MNVSSAPIEVILTSCRHLVVVEDEEEMLGSVTASCGDMRCKIEWYRFLAFQQIHMLSSQPLMLYSSDISGGTTRMGRCERDLFTGVED